MTGDFQYKENTCHSYIPLKIVQYICKAIVMIEYNIRKESSYAKFCMGKGK